MVHVIGADRVSLWSSLSFTCVTFSSVRGLSVRHQNSGPCLHIFSVTFLAFTVFMVTCQNSGPCLHIFSVTFLAFTVSW